MPSTKVTVGRAYTMTPLDGLRESVLELTDVLLGLLEGELSMSNAVKMVGETREDLLAVQEGAAERGTSHA